jgi:single-stranded-DNA-specific exonuclease
MQIEKRGNHTKIEDFVHPSITNTNHPYKFDTKNAPELIMRGMLNGEDITTIGDYDCDGVFASGIMFRGFNRLKQLMVQYKTNDAAMLPIERNRLLQNIQRILKCDAAEAHNLLMANKADETKIRLRLPMRYTEGYGMKEHMVDEIASGILVTVDNGIAAIDAVQKAVDKGLTTIVTDHHGLPVTKKLDVINGEMVYINEYTIPNAHCVINPHMEESMNEPGHYDFYDYCGAGVALKVIEDMIGTEDAEMNKLYAFAAIATVADVMPMVEDNRNIFFRGVDAMREGDITNGLKALLAASKIDASHMPENMPTWVMYTSDAMGFNVAPKVNAPGRVGTTHPASMNGDRGAERSLRCILETDPKKALTFAEELLEANERRKNISKEMQMKADIVIASENMQNDVPLVVYLPDCQAGVIGLVAGYLCETYNVPAIVFNDEGGICHGSARSPEGINIKELLDECQEFLVTYGGHPGAAGLTVATENIEPLREKLLNICAERNYVATAHDTIPYDLEIDAKDLRHNLNVLVNRLAPFGEQNQEPVFLVRNFPIQNINVLGGKHLKITGNGASAIGFSLAEDESIMEHMASARTCDLLGTISYNCFRGNATPQLSIQQVVDGREIIRDEPDEPDRDEEEHDEH